MRFWLVTSILLLGVTGVFAQSTDVSVLVQGSGAGCTVQADPGVPSVTGVTHRVTATADATQVQTVTLEVCNSGSFGPASVIGGGYPVALNQGVNGADGVEIGVDGSQIGAAGSGSFGTAFVADDGGSVDLAGGGALGFTVPVPFSPWMPWVLAAMVGFAALLVLRKQPALTMVALFVVSFAVWAMNFMADGDLSDWTGIAPTSDPLGDPTAGGNRADIVATFQAEENGRFFFRVDIADLEQGAPVATDDAFTTDEDTAFTTGNVLSNDTDPDGDLLTVQSVDTSGTQGTVTNNGDGTFDYDPNGLFESLGTGDTASDTFTYTVDDGQGNSDTATVTITINGVNDAPIAVADNYSTAEDTQLVISAPGVLTNDSDVEGDPITAVLDTDVSSGTLALSPDGSFTYDPNVDFAGTDSFTYHANDGTADSNVVTVTITVSGQNDPPVAVTDAYSTDEDSQLMVAASGVLGNDTDADGDPLTAVLDTDVSNGTLILNSDGSFTYDPNADFNGSDSFTYHANDGTADSNTVTVTITVNPINDPPIAVADSYSTSEDTQLAVMAPGVLMNDSDVDGNALTAVLDTDVSSGTLMLNADGSFTYDPNADFNGTDSFTYHANDGTVDSNIVTVTITVNAVNDPPVAVDDGYATDEDTSLNIAAPGVLTNDSDPESNPITVSAFDATSAQGAAVSVSADGSFIYNPTGSAALQMLSIGGMVADTFTYTISDGAGGMDTATVTVTVTGVDDAPTALDDTATVTEDDPATTIDVQANDTDPDGGTNTINAVTQPTNGSVVITNANADLTYEPNPNYCNDGITTDDFTYTLNGGSTATVAMTVTCVNDPPVADNETIAAACNIENVTESDPGQIAAGSGAIFTTTNDNVLIGDSDPVEGTAISIVQAGADTTAPFTTATSQGGTATLYADGSFIYTPQGGDRGVADTFTYTIEDADGGQDTGTVTINVGSSCVWFVDNSTNAGADDVGSGTSSDPFTSLVDEAGPDDMLADDAEDASIAGDDIYVFEGNSTSGDVYDGGFVADANQRLLGQGVDLTLDLLDGNGVQTLFSGNPANRPLVMTTAGDTIQITDVDNVEVAGFQLNAADNAIHVDAPTAGITADIHDNAINAAGLEGILISHANANSSIVNLSNNTVVSTGNGIDATAAAGGLELMVDTNTNINAGGNAIDIDGTGADALYISSFCQNTIDGNTAMNGIVVTNAIFDANPADMDFLGDEVACTSASVGTMANPVSTSGMVLTNVRGDLDLGALNIHAAGVSGTALQVTGNGVFNPGGGAGFQLSASSGAISASAGSGVVLSQLDLEAAQFTSITAQNGQAGMVISNVSGNLNVTGATNLSSMSLDGVNIVSSSANVTFAGQLTISTVSDAGIDLDGMTGNLIVQNAGSSIAGTTGDAFRSVNGRGNIDYNGTITNTSANSVDIRNHGGTVGNATISFDGFIDDDGAGINLDNNDQGLGSTVNFTGGLDLDTGVNTAFNATNGGTVNVESGGVSTTADTTTGTVVNLINSTIGGSGVTFDSTSTNGGANGVLLTNVGTGDFASLNGNLANQTSRGVDVSGGSGNVTVNASISTTATGRSVEVTTHTGGTVDFNGFIDDNGIGIRAENNVGAVLRFDGGMDVDTAGGVGEEGFQATGGGTIHVTGTNDVSTSAGFGIAVNIASGVTIGSDNVTFRNVSASGAPSGILLNGTGTSGTFTVTGSGAAASGGSIQNTTSNSIDLTNVQGVSFAFMDIDGSAANGIRGSNVTNFALSNSTLENNGDAVNEGAIRFDQNLLGTATISNSTIRASAEHNIEIINTSATQLNLGITNSTISDTALSGLGADGLLVETRNSADANVTVTNATFTNNVSDGIQVSAIDSSRASLIVQESGGVTTFSTGARALNLSAATNADLDFSVSDASFTGFSPALGEEAINLAMVSTTTAASSMVGTISNNTFSNSGGAVGIDTRGDGVATLAITGNTATTSINFEVIDIITGDAVGDAGVLNLTATGNTVTSSNGDAFYLEALRATSLCLNIRNNTAMPGAFSDAFAIFDSTTGITQLESGATDCGGACASATAHITATNTGAPVNVDPFTLVGPGTCPTPP